jgi:DNA-binding MarR family transcriptional regulator
VGPLDTEDIWFGLITVREQLVAALDEQLRARHGLAVPAFVVLSTVAKQPEPVAVTALAPQVPLVSRSQVSRLVDTLTERGLVERVRGTGDGRVHAVTITAAGRALAAEGIADADEVARRLVLDRLPAADVDALRRVLRRLVTPSA